MLLLAESDHLLDIMNSRTNDRSDEKKINHINKGDHVHVKELLRSSGIVMRWKMQASRRERVDRPSAWLTKEAGSDFIGIGLGVAALAALHAESIGGPIILRRLDQDCCEHHFANLRQRAGHGKVDVGLAKQGEMMSTSLRLTAHAKSNSRGVPPDTTEPAPILDLRLYAKMGKKHQKRESEGVTW